MARESVGQMLTLILRFGSSSSTSGFLVNYSRVVVILRVAVMGNSWDFHAELRSAPLLLFSVDSQPVELNCCWVEGEDVRRETTETAEAAQCALLTNVDSVVFSRDSARVQSRSQRSAFVDGQKQPQFSVVIHREGWSVQLSRRLIDRIHRPTRYETIFF